MDKTNCLKLSRMWEWVNISKILEPTEYIVCPPNKRSDSSHSGGHLLSSLSWLFPAQWRGETLHLECDWGPGMSVAHHPFSTEHKCRVCLETFSMLITTSSKCSIQISSHSLSTFMISTLSFFFPNSNPFLRGNFLIWYL